MTSTSQFPNPIQSGRLPAQKGFGKGLEMLHESFESEKHKIWDFWNSKPPILREEVLRNMLQTHPLYHDAAQPILWHRSSLKDVSTGYTCGAQHVPWGDWVLVYSHLVRSSWGLLSIFLRQLFNALRIMQARNVLAWVREALSWMYSQGWERGRWCQCNSEQFVNLDDKIQQLKRNRKQLKYNLPKTDIWDVHQSWSRRMDPL